MYKTVTIGDQVWLAENLAYLPSVVGPATGSEDTGHETDPYYYVYDYDGTDVAAAKATANYTTYGVLYNWLAALTACPEGWHLPSNEELTQLEIYLANNGHNYDSSIGGVDVRAKIAKSMAADSGWALSIDAGNVGNTDYQAYRNKSGFSALPGGCRTDSGAFGNIGNYGDWWSSTMHTVVSAWGLGYNYSQVHRSSGIGMQEGFSVRCVRD